MKIPKVFLCLLGIGVLTAQTLSGQEVEEPITATVTGHVFKPASRKATTERVRELQVPAGFTVEKFAEGLGEARMITVSEGGDVYVTIRDQNKVVRLRDADKDGKAEEITTVAELEKIHGITIHDGTMYLATVTELYEAQMLPTGEISEPKLVIDDLPDGGQHPNRTIAFGPDNKLYVSIGSTCNACDETNEEHATIVQMNADGSDRKVFANGLRNTLGFGWHPQTAEMWGMDHGMDWLGDDEQKEELNRVEEGKNYGWPYIYENGKYNPGDQPDGMSYEEYAATATSPVLLYPQAHAAALGMLFYTGKQFPEAYQGDAFIALHGSWNRSEPVGYKVVRLRYAKDGTPQQFEDFLTGFLIEGGKAHFGRPVGLAIYTDGSLLVTDDSNGVIYRVAYGN
jgi:glucose/arabinose dehydrogenase